jgi:uncharacterized protein YdeI (YjbR/CyaY-like superfamily)
VVTAPFPKQIEIFPSAAEFRNWLEANHDTAADVWIGYYKKGVPKASVSYPESVDEALSFGWIDGITRRIDDELYATRFTPRRKRSNWSAVNVARVGELTAAGRMHPAGIDAFEARTADKTGVYSYENHPADLPIEYRRQLQTNTRAWSWWKAQPPSYRRAATWWVVSAKREATRERRMATLIQDCYAGRMIQQQRYGKPDA